MKILVFTEGTIFTNKDWLALSRDEIIRAVNEGKIPDYSGTIPIGEAVKKLKAWKREGAEIIYLTSRRTTDEIEKVKTVLRLYRFPQGQLLSRQEGEEYKDVAERVLPDIIVEDDCESIGGEVEMTYPSIRPVIKEKIKSVVVKEFIGINHLPDCISSLVDF